MESLYSWFLNKVRLNWDMGRSWLAGQIRWSAYPIQQVYRSIVAAYSGNAIGAAMQDNPDTELGELISTASPFVPTVGQILTPRQMFDMFPAAVAGPFQGEAIMSYQTEFSEQWNTFREFVDENDILTRISTGLENIVIKQYLLTGTGRPRLISWVVIGRVNQFQLN